MRGFICALWLLISAAHAGTAAEQPVIVDVQREAGNVYRFSMQFVANAAPESVFAVITNYNQLTELNPLIKSSRLLPSNSPGVDRVELITEGCLLFFCKKIRRVEDARVDDDLNITTVIVPSMSDFKSGDTRWTFKSDGDKTIVNYIASMQPDFWLPPFVGPYALKRQIRSQLQYTARKINSILASNAS
tara:strand:- start:399 stop:965 length:567 start_codon:yes stop_codon:yes gene_type:complete